MSRSVPERRPVAVALAAAAFVAVSGAHAADELRTASLAPYPQPIALAATWDTALIRDIHADMARSIRARGGRFAIGPSLEIARDPRRGKPEEGFGEDAFLVGEMGVAAIEGLQGPASSPRLAAGRVLAAVEGFAGPPLARTDMGPSPMSMRELRETYFPPFEAAVTRAGVEAIVVSRADLDAIPSHANPWLLRDVLKGEWKYGGLVLAAREGIDDLHRTYGVAASRTEAAALAKASGIDADVTDGERAMGLGGATAWPATPHRAAAPNALARRAAERAIVLLKNDGTLPLAKPKVFVAAFGGGLEALVEALRSGARASAAMAGSPEGADRIVAVVAAEPGAEALRRFASVLRLGKPVVAVLAGGRPAAPLEVVEGANAVVAGWNLGEHAGAALTAVLFGAANPGGKLPLTLARKPGQLPLFHDAKPSARRGYLFDTSDPLYPFGFGLSYTTFEVGAPRLSSPSMAIDGKIDLTVDVKNTGARAGDETVQIYVRDKVSSVARPVQMLRGFQRVTLAAGESRKLTFSLDARALAMWNADMKRVVEPGEFEVMAGASSAKLQAATLTVTGGAAK